MMRRIFLEGSMMKTDRMVKAMPFSSTLVASWWSILAIRLGKCSDGQETRRRDAHVVGQSHLSLFVANDGKLEVGAGDFIDVLDPARVRVDCVGRETNQLDAAFGELGFEFGKGAELGSANGGVVLAFESKVRSRGSAKRRGASLTSG